MATRIISDFVYYRLDERLCNGLVSPMTSIVFDFSWPVNQLISISKISYKTYIIEMISSLSDRMDVQLFTGLVRITMQPVPIYSWKTQIFKSIFKLM